MSSRTTRRSARRAAVVDSDDELSTASITQIHNDGEDEIQDDTSRISQTKTRRARSSVAPAAAPSAAQGRGRPKKTSTPGPEAENEESADDLAAADLTMRMDATSITDSTPDDTALKQEEDDDVTQLPDTSAHSNVPKIRRSSASARSSIASKADVVPPTPQSSARPPPATPMQATPLTDITSLGVNTQVRDDPQTTIRGPKFNNSIMDKPLDIMLKSRTTTIPFVEETAPKSRTVLSYLILENFKSYAGRQEVGPFHASFTSVVGPNGSGKSNVIDSLLFVFGFRASKMRQGKISALIHNSADFPNLNYCEVAVHFKEVMDKVSGSLRMLCNAPY